MKKMMLGLLLCATVAQMNAVDENDDTREFCKKWHRIVFSPLSEEKKQAVKKYIKFVRLIDQSILEAWREGDIETIMQLVEIQEPKIIEFLQEGVSVPVATKDIRSETQITSQQKRVEMWAKGGGLLRGFYEECAKDGECKKIMNKKFEEEILLLKAYEDVIDPKEKS